MDTFHLRPINPLIASSRFSSVCSLVRTCGNSVEGSLHFLNTEKRGEENMRNCHLPPTTAKAPWFCHPGRCVGICRCQNTAGSLCVSVLGRGDWGRNDVPGAQAQPELSLMVVRELFGQWSRRHSEKNHQASSSLLPSVFLLLTLLWR